MQILERVLSFPPHHDFAALFFPFENRARADA
jgi:hypothetical protein